MQAETCASTDAVTPRQGGRLAWIVSLYLDGFRSMTLGRTLWKIIIIKLVIMFGVLKLFFFPDLLAVNYATDEERAEHVLNELIGSGLPANDSNEVEQ